MIAPVRASVPIWRLERTLERVRTALEEYRQAKRRRAGKVFFEDLVRETGNLRTIRWLGQPVWQNVLVLWTIQETLVEEEAGGA